MMKANKIWKANKEHELKHHSSKIYYNRMKKDMNEAKRRGDDVREGEGFFRAPASRFTDFSYRSL